MDYPEMCSCSTPGGRSPRVRAGRWSPTARSSRPIWEWTTMVEVEQLDVHYGDLQVLWDVSLHVNEGEIVALIGPNGAGKSTLLRTMTGLIAPTRGSIRFNGVHLDHQPPHTITGFGISMVPEGRRLFPKMTVLQNLELGAFRKPARLGKEKNCKQG